MDHILLKVERGPYATSDVAAIREKVMTEPRLRTNSGYEIEFHPYQSLS